MIIYIAINCSNNKCYVGQTVHSVSRRRTQHFSTSLREKRKGVFNQAIRKYGKDAFVWYEVASANTIEELNALEVYYVKYFSSMAPHGYNLHPGGLNKVTHELTKMKRRGKKASPESRLKMSLAQLGRKRSPEHCAAIGAGSRGRKVSLEVREKTRLKQPTRISIILRNKETLEIRVFSSLTEAAHELKTSRCRLEHVIAGTNRPSFPWQLLSA